MTPDERTPHDSSPTDHDLRAALGAEHARLVAAVEAAQQEADDASFARFATLLERHLAAHDGFARHLRGPGDPSAELSPRPDGEATIAQQLTLLRGETPGGSTFTIQLALLAESLERHLSTQLTSELPVLLERLDDDERRSFLDALQESAHER